MPSSGCMSVRFAAAVLAFGVEANAAELPLEYAQALESDDMCLPGGSSCSLALSQLRASAHGRHSSLSERPISDRVLENIDPDLALLASGVPPANIAALMVRDPLEFPTNNIAPAVLHSELPWAAAAAHEAEQKVARDEAQAPLETESPSAAQVEPQAKMVSGPVAQPQAQPPAQPQAQPQVQPQVQPQTQPHAQPLAKAAGAQPTPQQLAAQVPQAAPQGVQQDTPSPVSQAAPQAAPQVAVQAASEAAPEVAPEGATQAVPQDGAVLSSEGSQDDAGEHGADNTGDEERRLLGVDAYTKSELFAMAGEKGGKVLWDAAAPYDAGALDSSSVDASKTKQDHHHHDISGPTKVRSHSKKTHSHGKLSQSHGKTSSLTGSAGKHNHAESRAVHAEQNSTKGLYTKAEGGYQDVVLSRPGKAKHHVHARAPVSLSSEKGDKFRTTAAKSTHVRSKVDVEIDSAVDSEGFEGRLQAFRGHPRWMENCTQIFLDVGTGKGTNIKALYEPESLDMSMKFLLTLQQVFKLPEDRRLPSSESGLCALGMEPDPKYHTQLHELKKKYKARGWNVHFYPFAAWGSSAGLLSLGAGKVSDATQGSGSSHHKAATEVMTVGLPDFIRSFPPKAGVSLLLLDIGGAEGDLLPSLLAERVLCQSVTRSALIAGSPEDIVKLEHSQGCSGKVTPVVELSSYLA